MENPATWGEAELVVRRELDSFFANQEKKITDPSKIMVGLSLERRITDALRTAGLLKDLSGGRAALFGKAAKPLQGSVALLGWGPRRTSWRGDRG